MKTRVVRVDPHAGPWPALPELAGLITDGGLVAIPTETVYGIAVNLRDAAAVRRLHQLKGRPADKPLTVHLGSADDLARIVKEVPHRAAKLAHRFWPGPLTLVIPDRHGRTTGFRVPDLPVTQRLLRLCGVRVGAPSANPTGDPPPRTAQEVLEHFDGLLDAVLDAGPCRHGQASTVVRVIGEGVEILRQGVVPEREVRDATSRLILLVGSSDRCRTAIAAATLRQLAAARLGTSVAELLEHGLRIESAGTAALSGSLPTPEAQGIATEAGLDLSGHRSRPLTPGLIEDADLLLVMDPGQRSSILEFAADAVDRMDFLDQTGRPIEDPAGGGEEAHQAALRHLRAECFARREEFFGSG